MTDKDIYTTIDKTKGEIQALENYTIPEIEGYLEYLESPEYDPEDNPGLIDPEDEIDHLTWELRGKQEELDTLQDKLQELYRKLTRIHLGSGSAD